MDEQKRLNLVIVMLLALLIMLSSVIYYLVYPNTSSQSASLAQEEASLKEQVFDTSAVEFLVEMDQIRKADIISRIARPVYAYYTPEKHGQIVSFMVDLNPQTDPNFPYVATVGFEDGAQEKFVVQEHNLEIQWWIPNCVECGFTDEFRSTYPEVVSYVEG